MGNKMNLEDCIRLAEFAHFHQRDKAGMAYITHPMRVLANVQAQGAQPYVQMAAVLHDVTEDTPFTPEMLVSLGVPEAAVEIIKLVDRDISKSRFDIIVTNRDRYVFDKGCLTPEYSNAHYNHEFLHDALTADEFYYAEIKKNPGAVVVKLADIGDNLQPWRLSYLPEATQARLRAKYAKAIELLTGA